MKIPKGLKLTREIFEDIDNFSKINPDFVFSEWVENKWKEEKMTPNGIKNEIKKLEKIKKNLKKRAEMIKKEKEKKLNSLSNEQLKMVKETLEVLKNKPRQIKGRLNLWNNSFPDKIITIDELKELLGVYDEHK